MTRRPNRRPPSPLDDFVRGLVRIGLLVGGLLVLVLVVFPIVGLLMMGALLMALALPIAAGIVLYLQGRKVRKEAERIRKRRREAVDRDETDAGEAGAAPGASPRRKKIQVKIREEQSES